MSYAFLFFRRVDDPKSDAKKCAEKCAEKWYTTFYSKCSRKSRKPSNHFQLRAAPLDKPRP